MRHSLGRVVGLRRFLPSLLSFPRRLHAMAYSVEERGSLYSTDYRLYFS